jgi:DNA-binding NtrC family response regulator
MNADRVEPYDQTSSAKTVPRDTDESGFHDMGNAERVVLMVPPGSIRRLLLVEDDQMVRETIILMLEDEYEILHAVSVGTALAQVQAADEPGVDLMLLDCLLPGGSVADLLAVADQRSIPVVLISGDPNQAMAVDPARPFLPKPFSQGVLLAVLESARR